MAEITIHLMPRDDGSVEVSAEIENRRWDHLATADAVQASRRSGLELMTSFDSGHQPLVDPVALAEIGAQLLDTFLKPLHGELENLAMHGPARLLFSSSASNLLNLPWELLPGLHGQFLVADARCAIRRTTRTSLSPTSMRLAAPPLRILFAACAPSDLPGLDYEKEEDAILRITHRLGGKVHLEIAEAGTFEELRDRISEYQPHIVHLSGHGQISQGVGYFAFENERGRADSRDAAEIAEQLFAGRGVRLVFISGCETAQSAAAGVCQTLTARGHVPLVLGWCGRIADEHAIEFARVFYHELAVGRPVDVAVATARGDMLARCRVRHSSIDLLDPSFALPQVYAADLSDALLDDHLPSERPERPDVRYELLGDNIRGLRDGFVGRRRLLQRTRPALRTGEKTVLLLTGIGGAGKSTLATRLANQCSRDGFRVVALQARREEGPQFCLKIVSELANACLLLGHENYEHVLRDGNRPIPDRLRFGIEVLNQTKILLVLDNLEALMPQPPVPLAWESPDFAVFFHALTSRLTREGRAILTCRYRPNDFDPTQPNLAHEPMPDFSEADYFKYLRRHEKVAGRMQPDELSRDLLQSFYRKLGATPRFIEQATAVLARIEPDTLRDQLDGLAEGETEELQQQYFRDLFLPELYDALAVDSRLALSRLAVVEVPLPVDGVSRVAGLANVDANAAIHCWIALGLAQRFGEADEVPLYAAYPLQREFLVGSGRLPVDLLQLCHQQAAAFLQECYEHDREVELRLTVSDALLWCLHHAREAGDRKRQRWAAVRIAEVLYQRAEYQAVLDLVEPLLTTDRDPDQLIITGDALSSIGERDKARKRFDDAMVVYEAAANQQGRVHVLRQIALIDFAQGFYPDGRDKMLEALAISRNISYREGEVSALTGLAAFDLSQCNYNAAREKYEKVLNLLQFTSIPIRKAEVLYHLATIELREGRYPQARQISSRALDAFQALKDRFNESALWHQLGSIDLKDEKYADARQNFEKALKIRQAVADRPGQAASLHQLASLDLYEGKYPAASVKFREALSLIQEIGDQVREASIFFQIGAIALAKFRLAVGIRLIALTYLIEMKLQLPSQKETSNTLSIAASQLRLDANALSVVLTEAAEEYQLDSAAGLIRHALEGL